MAALSVDKSLLDQFWKLSDNKDANRIEAAIKILKYINFNQVKIWSTFKHKKHMKHSCLGFSFITSLEGW